MTTQDVVDLLTLISNTSVHDYDVIDPPASEVLADMIALRYVHVLPSRYCVLTSSGRLHLYQLKRQLGDQQQQQAKADQAQADQAAQAVVDRKRERRMSFVRSALDFLVSLIPQHLGVLSDFFKNLVIKISALFH